MGYSDGRLNGMDENCLAYGIEISEEDWEKTPASVKKLVEQMGQRIKQSEKKLVELEAQQQQLLEKINRTSKNSSTPPSSDPPSAEKRPEKNYGGKASWRNFCSKVAK